MNAPTCDHPAFETTVTINRLTDDEGGPATAFAADVRVRCAACGEPFVFLCPDVGLLPDRPAVSADGQELRAPLAPAGTPDGYRMAMGYRLTTVRPPSAN